MRIIVPMAGIGKRMRPHTLTTPKPLLPIAGQPIVQRLVNGIASVCREKIEEVAFIIGDFGPEVEQDLLNIANELGAKGSIYHQDEALGTAHAVLCAGDSLQGKVTIAFADTLFYADFKLDESQDGIIWVEKVEDPRAFGVVKLDKNGVIQEFVEKPEQFVSDLAIIGIYYFKSGETLKKELQYLIDKDIKEKGEYQLTNALENMKQKGMKFYAGEVDEWLDCGNKNATVHTNKRVLEREGSHIDKKVSNEHSVIIEPCYIGKNVKLKNSVIGPHVSIGSGSTVENSVIENSIVQKESQLVNMVIGNSMIGNKTMVTGKRADLSLGDFNEYA
jgi:glucose-1-phosphate thymidylyltransferase